MHRRCAIFALISATILGASCASKSSAVGKKDTRNEPSSADLDAFWAGRISLRVQSEPPQAFFAGFELKGRPDNGELALISPLGSILGMLRWTPLAATLEQGSSTQRFASTDDLLAQTTGAAIPISALFDWLAGINTEASGWVVDLARQANGRISAKRLSPLPQADLLLVLDK